MAEASIPVDLFNPGQVFACLGFLEAAEVLCGDAEGGFDWSDESDVRFAIQANGGQNPFEVALAFLAKAQIHRCAPPGYMDSVPPCEEEESQEPGTEADDLRFVDAFPNSKGDRMSLPIRLAFRERPSIDLGHWTDGSSRNNFKLYSGNRSAHRIATAMLRGTRGKPRKKQEIGELLTRGINALWDEHQEELIANPFGVLTLMGGSFNFDPRGAWTGLNAGFSPDQQQKSGSVDGIAASPVVEILAAWGLENARPDEYGTREVRYGAWGRMLPPLLARLVLSGVSVGAPCRRFRFVLALSGKNKVMTFAEEEMQK